MTHQPSLSNTSPGDWKYVAEGGASIVFSYTGPADHRFSGTVLRLRKTTHDFVNDSAAESLPTKDIDDLFIPIHQRVTRRLVPEGYLPRLLSARVEREWLMSLDQLSANQRPLDRLRTDRIDISRHNAILVTDLVGSAEWAVEIKARTCRFCMHTSFKAGQRGDTELHFCPLDLYSGEEYRVRRALCALWDSWISSCGTINNLKIFVKGEVLKPTGEVQSLQLLVRQLSRTETATFDTSAALSLRDIRERFVASLLPILLETSVLYTLSNLQRTLDPLDIEGLSTLWTNSYPQFVSSSVFGTSAQEPTLEEWTRFIDEYLSRTTITGRSGHHPDPQPEDLRYYCLAYLLSATFKDCSIMISMTPATGEQDAGRRGSVKIVDLDVKRISRLAKWERLDKEIVSAYASSANPRTCVDQQQVMES
ncbi:predicted protein [Postia placenta Mad-698-R]|nr:predicted protein [Postia placenta Mad-698-R]